MDYFANSMPFAENMTTFMNSLAFYEPNYKVEISPFMGGLLFITCISGLVFTYSSRVDQLEKNKREEEVRSLLVFEAIRRSNELLEQQKGLETLEYKNKLIPRIDTLDERLAKVADDLKILYKICPEMSQRKVTIGGRGATWYISSIRYADTVIIEYDLVDIASSELLESSQVEYSCVYIPSAYGVANLQADAEIIIPAGAKMIVTKAYRYPRGLDRYGSIDMTEEAKATLETKVLKFAP